MRNSFLFSTLFLICSFSYGQNQSVISTENIQKDIKYLSSDELKGRKPGTEGDSLAAFFIRKEMKDRGATPIFDHGFQRFSVLADVRPGKNNILQINGSKATPEEDFIPATFSSADSLESTVVFAGYGFNFEKDSTKWNDYENINVKDKWVMVLAGKPDISDNDVFNNYSRSRTKALTAKDKGAKGMLIVVGSKDDFSMLRTFDNSASDAGIPVFFITQEKADEIIKKDGSSIEKLRAKITKEKKPSSLALKANIKGRADLIHKKSTTYNVVSKLEGTDPVLKNEYIVIGAHYDHLGMGGPESGSRMPDTIAIHNGADDNASGVAGVIELAGAFASSPVKPKRTLIFVAFSGEEMGMLGSKEFVKNPPYSLKSVKAMFNFDMIGRMKTDNPKLSIGGTGTSTETDSLIKLLDKDLSFGISKSPEGYGPSDHASFYKNDIPVFFITTGVHDDYHTPFDDADKINFPQEVNLLNFSYRLIDLVANQDKALTFKEAGSKEEGEVRSYKVTLGIIPDYVGSSDKGMTVDGVKKGGPAEAGGLKKGDIITAINDLPVANIYDYMARLNTLKKGQLIKVEILRDGKKEVLNVQL